MENKENNTQRVGSILGSSQPPAASSGNSEWEDYQEKLKREIQRHEESKQQRSIGLADFEAAAQRYCTNGPFVIDQDNMLVIEQLALYINEDERFPGNLQKGICLMGPKGTGKSVLIKVLNHLLPEREKFFVDNLVQLAGYYSQKDVGDMCFNDLRLRFLKGGKRNNRCGNDLGREKDTVQHMGNNEDVGAKYIYERYDLFQDHRLKTHFTTNFLMEDDFVKRYGDLNHDRIKEMCNFFELAGPSRR